VFIGKGANKQRGDERGDRAARKRVGNSSFEAMRSEHITERDHPQTRRVGLNEKQCSKRKARHGSWRINSRGHEE
jgi:hypothetical protein